MRHRYQRFCQGHATAGCAILEQRGELEPNERWHGVPSFVTVGSELYAISSRLRNPCKGEKRHDLRKFLFFAREGMVSQSDEEGQGNQAACLNLLTNAVIVWNTVYMQAAPDTLQHEGYPIQEEDLVHLWPTRFAHVHRYGKYEFNVEAARTRTGLRPLEQ
jgi:hypothetical protein